LRSARTRPFEGIGCAPGLPHAARRAASRLGARAPAPAREKHGCILATASPSEPRESRFPARETWLAPSPTNEKRRLKERPRSLAPTRPRRYARPTDRVAAL